MGIISFVFGLYLTVSAYGNEFIDHKAEIKKAQDFVNSYDTDYPIIVFDRDEINYLFAQRGLLDPKKEQERMAFIIDYVKEKTQLELTVSEASNLESFLFPAVNSVVALPLIANKKTRFCGVFPGRPNGNQRLAIERIIGMDTVPKNFPGTYNQLKNKLSYKTMYLFSLYHEIGHCLDDTYLPEAQQTGAEPGPHDIHQSEAFAETFAYLALAEELGFDIAPKRAMMRALFSRVMGEYLPTCSSFGNKNRGAGGSIYYLTPYLMDAYEKLEFKEIKLERSKFISDAKKILEQISPDGRELKAIEIFLKQGWQAAETQYKEWAIKDPQFFYGAYELLRSYVNLTDLWLEASFDLTLPKKVRELSKETLDLEKLSAEVCSALKTGSYEDYLRVVNRNREVISNNMLKYEDSLSAKQVLDNLSQACFPELQEPTEPPINSCGEKESSIFMDLYNVIKNL